MDLKENQSGLFIIIMFQGRLGKQKTHTHILFIFCMYETFEHYLILGRSFFFICSKS